MWALVQPLRKALYPLAHRQALPPFLRELALPVEGPGDLSAWRIC